MTPRRWALVALGLAALVWALGGEWVSISHGVPESHLLDVTVGLSFFAAGIVALDRRPGNVIGPLMIAFAATWFLGKWGNLPIPVFPTLIFVAGLFGAPLLAHSTPGVSERAPAHPVRSGRPGRVLRGGRRRRGRGPADVPSSGPWLRPLPLDPAVFSEPDGLHRCELDRRSLGGGAGAAVPGGGLAAVAGRLPG